MEPNNNNNENNANNNAPANNNGAVVVAEGGVRVRHRINLVRPPARVRVRRSTRRERNLGAQERRLVGDPVRRVLDTYCPYCATDIRAPSKRRLVRCPNVAICGKILPFDENCCSHCYNYTRPADNFCRVCRANLKGVVRAQGGLFQHLRRAPSPINNLSPPRQASGGVEESDEREEEHLQMLDLIIENINNIQNEAMNVDGEQIPPQV